MCTEDSLFFLSFVNVVETSKTTQKETLFSSRLLKERSNETKTTRERLSLHHQRNDDDRDAKRNRRNETKNAGHQILQNRPKNPASIPRPRVVGTTARRLKSHTRPRTVRRIARKNIPTGGRPRGGELWRGTVRESETRHRRQVRLFLGPFSY